jgi:hypothetical protein
MHARLLWSERWLFFATTLILCVWTAHAQSQHRVAEASAAGEPIMLDDGWRFQAGDDPRWSLADWDDSQWQAFDPHKTLAQQGFADFHGFVWLRIHVRLPATHGPWSLFLDRAGNSYQVFLDGRHIGNYGNFTSRYGYLYPVPRLFSLGDQVSSGSTSGDPSVIALRFFRPAHRVIGLIGPHAVMLGPSSAVDAFYRAARSAQVIEQADESTVAFLGILIGCGLMGLFIAQRSHQEYLWAGLSLACIGLYYAIGVISLLGFLSVWTTQLTYFFFGYASIVAGSEFLFRFVGQTPGKLLRGYQIAVLACTSLGLLTYYGLVSAVTSNLVAGLVISLYAILSAVLLVIWFLRGKREAAILVLPVVLFGIALPLDFFSGAIYILGWTKTPDALIPDLHFGPVHFVFSAVVICLYMLSYVVILGYRLLHSSREQERSAAELAAAHRIQARLVPVTFPNLGQFSMEAAYIAATEVGGDFYQAFPEEDGSLLFFLGDVSGKGLSAAMVGTLIVGAIRTLAVQKLSPARSLALLNEQLVGQTDGGFATCLCARISPLGAMTVSNAGHLAPYLDGVELDLENGLPLGISNLAQYTEQTVELPPGARLTFMSDGVVEAKNAHQELLGFARTQQLSTLPAADIAEAAQKFGQADDITVVTIKLAPA